MFYDDSWHQQKLCDLIISYLQIQPKVANHTLWPGRRKEDYKNNIIIILLNILVYDRMFWLFDWHWSCFKRLERWLSQDLHAQKGQVIVHEPYLQQSPSKVPDLQDLQHFSKAAPFNYQSSWPLMVFNGLFKASSKVPVGGSRKISCKKRRPYPTIS